MLKKNGNSVENIVFWTESPAEVIRIGDGEREDYHREAAKMGMKKLAL
jgi:hypothetical protein